MLADDNLIDTKLNLNINNLTSTCNYINSDLQFTKNNISISCSDIRNNISNLTITTNNNYNNLFSCADSILYQWSLSVLRYMSCSLLYLYPSALMAAMASGQSLVAILRSPTACSVSQRI